MGQHMNRVGTQCQAFGLALGGQWGFAIELGDVLLVGPSAIGVARQQDAQLFKAFADGGDGLRQVQVALPCAPLCQGVRLGVSGVDAAPGEHVGARRKAGAHGAAGHQDLKALRAVSEQQHGGCGAQGRGFTLGIKELGCACHAPLSGRWRFSQGR